MYDRPDEDRCEAGRRRGRRWRKRDRVRSRYEPAEVKPVGLGRPAATRERNIRVDDITNLRSLNYAFGGV